METFSISSLPALLLILLFSSPLLAFACGVCPSPPTPTPPKEKPPITLPPIIGKPPITLPPIIGKPPITLPPIIGKPPITLPPVIGKPPFTLPPVIGKPPITLPPITLPPIIGKPPITLPPIIGKPPITLPPIIGKPPTVTKPPVSGCAAPPPPTCPINALKLGACIDLLGNVWQIGDPAVNECCPILEGISGVEAAFCFCTTIKLKLLNTNVFLPIVFQLLISCGETPPPGFTCP